MADIILETKIPELFKQDSVDMLDMFSDGVITIKLNRGRQGSLELPYKFDAIKGGENQVDLGERFIKSAWLACLGIVELERVKIAKKTASDAVVATPVSEGSIA